MIQAPNGRWWVDQGMDSGVWPCEVISANVFGVRINQTLGPEKGEHTVPRTRVYDNRFNHPGDKA